MKIEGFQEWIFPLGSALVGALAWSGSMPAIALSILMPIFVTLQKTRRSGFCVALGYYLGASWPLIPGAKAFFGADATWSEATVLWLISSYLLALPFGVLWLRNIYWRPLGTLLALLFVAIPPIGTIGWASPLTAAGVLFPGTAWLGLAATLLICTLFSLFPRLVSVFAATLCVIAIANHRQPIIPPGWQAVDTHFGSGNGSDPLREFRIVGDIQRMIRQSDSKVLVFPEMVINRWNDATRSFWQPTIKHLRRKNRTVLIGAGISMPGQRQAYLNSVLILGRDPLSAFTQRIPVPIAMWNPYKSRDGVPLRVLGPGTIMVAGKRAAILICYEQLLTWPVLASVAEDPEILVGLANGYWATGSLIQYVQKACINAWARLFGLPLISASNS